MDSAKYMDGQKIYGYLRVSTPDQTIQGNKEAIILKATDLGLNASKIIWLEETVSGKKHWKKRKLNNIVEEIQKDDVFISFEISRIGRTVTDISEFMNIMLSKGVHIYFCNATMKIDNSVASQMYVFAYSMAAQLERELISQRTKAALDKRRANGLPTGRPLGPSTLCLDKHLDEIKKSIESGVKLKCIAEKYGVCQNTVTKFVKRHKLK